MWDMPIQSGERSIWNQKRLVSSCETVNCPDSLFPGNAAWFNSMINTFWRKRQPLQPKSEARLRDNCTDLFWQSSATKISSRPHPIKRKYFLHIFLMLIITAITHYVRAVLLALSGMNMAGENMTFISIFIKLLFSTVLIHSKYRKIPQWNRP